MNDDFIPANLGLRDQLFALEWLYENIKVFGGDPSNMALVGQGSGAASIAYHYQYSGSKTNIFVSFSKKKKIYLSSLFLQIFKIKEYTFLPNIGYKYKMSKSVKSTEYIMERRDCTISKIKCSYKLTEINIVSRYSF